MSRSGAKRRSGTDAGAARMSPAVSRRLKQIEACRRRGETVKAFAERTGQSVYPFYEARRRARRAGVLAAHAIGKRTPKPSEAPSGAGRRFVEAVVRTDPATVTRKDAVAWRLRLPSGAVLEAVTPLDAPVLDRLLAAFGSRS